MSQSEIEKYGQEVTQYEQLARYYQFRNLKIYRIIYEILRCTFKTCTGA